MSIRLSVAINPYGTATIQSIADKIANDKMRIQYQELVFIIQAGAGFGCGMIISYFSIYSSPPILYLKMIALTCLT